MRLIRAQLAAVPVRDRRENTGDVSQRHGGHGGAPGLVERLGQAGTEHDERIRAPCERGQDPGAGHGLVVKESPWEARVDTHCASSFAPCA